MSDLGHVPNLAAQMLASGLTYSVGVVLPPLITPDRASDPFFMEILTAINDEARKNDFTVSIATSDTITELKEQVQLGCTVKKEWMGSSCCTQRRMTLSVIFS